MQGALLSAIKNQFQKPVRIPDCLYNYLWGNVSDLTSIPTYFLQQCCQFFYISERYCWHLFLFVWFCFVLLNVYRSKEIWFWNLIWHKQIKLCMSWGRLNKIYKSCSFTKSYFDKHIYSRRTMWFSEFSMPLIWKI